MNDNLLSARGARHFLRRFWQKNPRLARGVLPQIDASVDRQRLIGLACRDDVESRLVIGARNTWEVRHGPFRRRDFTQLPPCNWTLLVNGVENFVPAARRLQMQFGFVPYARQDDVMVSYAAPGGSVGPHYDSYDVFLLQGAGTRRWQISRQADLALLDTAPLKILRRFRPRNEWVLHRGDLLYLPPNYAHYGIALDECITWSIGLRAPGRQEMAARFLDFLQDRLALSGEYRDPGLKLQHHPAAIGASMLRQVRAMTKKIRWNRSDIAVCLGEYLTEPRSNILFKRANRISAAQFSRRAGIHGLRLSLKSRMLLSGCMVFINGDAVEVDAAAQKLLQQFADSRSLPASARPNALTRELLYRWHQSGYIVLDNQSEEA